MSPRPQFPHPDYVGMMDTLARDLECVRRFPVVDVSETTQQGCYAHERLDPAYPFVVTPSCYPPSPPLSPSSLPMPSYQDLQSLYKKCIENGYLRSLIAYTNLMGEWDFQRIIRNTYDPLQSGLVSGRAHFYPFLQQHSSSSVSDLTSEGPHDAAQEKGGAQCNKIEEDLHYSENGVFVLSSTGRSFEVHREDVYSYNTSSDTIDINFYKNSRKGEHFLTLTFSPQASLPSPDTTLQQTTNTSSYSPSSSSSPSPPLPTCTEDDNYDSVRSSSNEKKSHVDSNSKNWWHAESEHYCSPDTYHAKYVFYFNRIHMYAFEVFITAKGPLKNYTTHTTYSRPK
jgi:hypothetical protein